jgi:hypothetical protein
MPRLLPLIPAAASFALAVALSAAVSLGFWKLGALAALAQ